jgi:hypothetical protein
MATTVGEISEEKGRKPAETEFSVLVQGVSVNVAR